jgi:hypothetical protein
MYHCTVHVHVLVHRLNHPHIVSHFLFSSLIMKIPCPAAKPNGDFNLRRCWERDFQLPAERRLRLQQPESHYLTQTFT